MKNPVQIVLLTGGSSGIGAATAQMLHDNGMIVYAASRRGSLPDGIQASSTLIPVKMDVNDADGIEAVVKHIVQQQGRLDAVVCNAGNGIAGAIEDTSEHEARTQMETCFFGAVKTIQACLPVFRRQGHGRIITVTSVAALIPIPYQAFYSAVKAALLIFTKALSIEVKPFGIQCCSILPGDTKTGFTSARKYTEASQDKDSPYYERMSASVGKMEHDEQNGMAPTVIARAVCHQLKRRRMSVTVTPRLDYKLIGLLSHWLPDRLMLWIVGLLY